MASKFNNGQQVTIKAATCSSDKYLLDLFEIGAGDIGIVESATYDVGGDSTTISESGWIYEVFIERINDTITLSERFIA